jgi:hypothetical protein
MPHLQHFTITNIPYSFDGAVLPQLRYLEAIAPEVYSPFDIDDIPNQIEVLKLCQYSLCHRRNTLAAPRHFPNLNELELIDVSISDSLMGCIMAPKLDDLSLDEYNSFDLTPMLQTLWHKGIPLGSTLLQNLTIRQGEFGPDTTPYMRQLDNLQTLKLISCTIWTTSLAPLWTFSENIPLFLPCLRSLVMEYSTSADGDHKFAEMSKECAAARPSLKLYITE